TGGFLRALAVAAIAFRWSGEVPQQPPTTRAPAWMKRVVYDAIVFGVVSYRATSPSMRGRPAFGLIHSGMRVWVAASSATTFSISSRERPQFAPTAATSSGVMASTILVGLSP